MHLLSFNSSPLRNIDVVPLYLLSGQRGGGGSKGIELLYKIVLSCCCFGLFLFFFPIVRCLFPSFWPISTRRARFFFLIISSSIFSSSSGHHGYPALSHYDKFPPWWDLWWWESVSDKILPLMIMMMIIKSCNSCINICLVVRSFVLPYIGTLCDSLFKRYKWLTSNISAVK